MVPEVPMLADVRPVTTIPLPTAVHALSAPPPITGVPGLSPVISATFGVIFPQTFMDS
jgi:hypothetical protein